MTTLLKAEDISVAIDGRVILNPSSFSVKKGELVGIIGPNGAGKSTMVKALCAMTPLASGKVYLKDQQIHTLPDKDRARMLAYMPQNTNVNFAYTVKDIVMTARYPYLKWWEQESQDDEKIVEESMRYMGVQHLANQQITDISGGERQRVILSKILAQQTDILVLDEPTAALDMGYADEIFQYCKQLCSEGKTILVVEHDLERVSKFCHRLLLIHDGRIVANGTPQEVLTEANLLEAFSTETSVYKDPFYDIMRIYVHKRAERDL